VTDAERETIEREYLEEHEYFDQLLAVEDDLFDEYVAEELSETERHLFEQTLLGTPQQQHKLRQARFLRQAMAARRPTESRTKVTRDVPKKSWLNIFQASRIPIWAGALTLLLLMAIGIWLVIREQEKGEPQRAQLPQNEESRPPIQSSPSLPSAASPKIVLALNDADGQVSIDDAGHISGLGELSPSAAKTVKEALMNEHVNLSGLDGLKTKNSALMGQHEEGVPIVLVEPIGRVLRSDRPTFVWRPSPGTTDYTVTVFDTKFKEVASSGPQTGSRWKVPAPLPRGQIYLWQVSANKNGELIKSPVPPAPEARFRIVSQHKVALLTQAEKAHQNSHLLLGVLYAEAGLLKKAQREFRLLLKANPGSPVAEKLLRQVSK
jgi:hypothetical protein